MISCRQRVFRWLPQQQLPYLVLFLLSHIFNFGCLLLHSFWLSTLFTCSYNEARRCELFWQIVFHSCDRCALKSSGEADFAREYEGGAGTAPAPTSCAEITLCNGDRQREFTLLSPVTPCLRAEMFWHSLLARKKQTSENLQFVVASKYVSSAWLTGNDVPASLLRNTLSARPAPIPCSWKALSCTFVDKHDCHPEDSLHHPTATSSKPFPLPSTNSWWLLRHKVRNI